MVFWPARLSLCHKQVVLKGGQKSVLEHLEM